MTRKPGRFALVFIFFTVALNMIGVGLIIPVMPSLIQDVAWVDLPTASRYGGFLLMTFAVMQFVCAPIVGGLSDRFGRRPVLLASLALYGLDFLLMAFAPSLFWLFLARGLSGVFGATYATASAYIADVSPPEKKAQNFGLIGAAFGLGFVIGPALGGLLGEIDIRAPFIAAAVLTFANLVFGWAVLPETLAPENRRAFSLRRANPLGGALAISRYPVAVGIGATLLLATLAHWSLTATWAYFTQERFGWSQLQVGLSLACVGVSSAVVMGGLSRTVIPRLGEARAAVLGFGVMAAQLFGFAVVTEGWMVYAVIVLGSLSGLAMPAVQGILSNAVRADQQGELQGAVASVQGLAAIAGPIIMTQLFYAFTAPDAPIYFPGAAFVLATGLALAALVPLTFALRLQAARPA